MCCPMCVFCTFPSIHRKTYTNTHVDYVPSHFHFLKVPRYLKKRGRGMEAEQDQKVFPVPF